MRLISRRIREHAALFAAPLFMATCNWGTRPKSFLPANSPQGVHVAVRVTGEQADRRGELFAVDSIGVTIAAPRLMRVSWNRVKAMDVDGMSRPYNLLPGERVTPEKRARLSLVSRFPQGLSGTLLAQVLSAVKQDSLEEVK